MVLWFGWAGAHVSWSFFCRIAFYKQPLLRRGCLAGFSVVFLFTRPLPRGAHRPAHPARWCWEVFYGNVIPKKSMNQAVMIRLCLWHFGFGWRIIEVRRAFIILRKVVQTPSSYHCWSHLQTSFTPEVTDTIRWLPVLFLPQLLPGVRASPPTDA